ncbi:MAG: OsmC family protein [Proteobacteria bacterium]|nr:OsmC family protein [Pseudomonadota bacterium]
MTDTVSVTLTRQSNYKFLVDYGAGMPAAVMDEPPPLGAGEGPSPVHALASAMASCLSASFVFALGKFKEDPGPLTMTATCTVGRNERNRLRVTGVDLTLTLGTSPQSLPHLERALVQFEDFCTVSQSIRAGIPYTLKVVTPDGQTIKAA